MNPSRIEKAIDEIYDYVENCKPAKLAPNKVTVAKDELYDLLDALRMCAPEEIRTYQKIIHNRDQILAKANAEAEQIRSQAQQETAQLLNESDLVQSAYAQAEQIMAQAQSLNQAVKESDQVRTSALYYTSDLLSQAGRNIETSLKEMESKSTMLISALKQDIEVIKANRSELMSQIQGGSAQQPEQAQEESEETAE
mgnify:CR=1 FL=1